MTRDSIEVRPARPGDAARMAALAGELGYPVDAATMAARLDTLLHREAHWIAVAAIDAGVAGWIALEQRELLLGGSRAEIMGLVVGAAGRRRGIGTALVRAAEHEAARRGLRALTVRSNAARTGSHPFYEQLGYARSKTQHVYVKTLSVPAPATRA
jgi:GNAT superfamily N-acetyltransferase